MKMKKSGGKGGKNVDKQMGSHVVGAHAQTWMLPPICGRCWHQ